MNISTHGLQCSLAFGKPDIEDWMRTTVTANAPGFQSQFSCTIQVDEWQQFVQVLRELSAAVGTEAHRSWGNMEANIEFEFTLKERGAVEGLFRLSPYNLSLGPVLSGSFDADQTFFAQWLREAEAVLENAR